MAMMLSVMIGGLLVCIYWGRTAYGWSDESTPPQPLSAPGQRWVLQKEFSDEFDGSSLDLRKWDHAVKSWGTWSWDPQNVRVEHGLLKLRMQHLEHQREGKKLFYTSGIVKSQAPPIKYGYFEARLKAAPLNPGVSPAFWLYRTEPEIWTEMDFELTHANIRPEHAHRPASQTVRLIEANSFVFRHPQLVQAEETAGMKVNEVHHWEAPWDPRDDFHIYAIQWDEEEIQWFVDGRLVRSRKNDYWHQALDLVISFGLRQPYAGKPSSQGFPTEFEVDYVRVWKRAAP